MWKRNELVERYFIVLRKIGGGGLTELSSAVPCVPSIAPEYRRFIPGEQALQRTIPESDRKMHKSSRYSENDSGSHRHRGLAVTSVEKDDGGQASNKKRQTPSLGRIDKFARTNKKIKFSSE
jgi:hypothetical protein